MKKLFSLIIMALLPVVASAQILEATIDGLNYYLDLNSHEAVLTHGYNCSGELYIPSEVSYNGETFVVKSMLWCAFYDNDELTSVKIPKTIESILHDYPVDPDDGEPSTGAVSPLYMNPFMGCTALESIEVNSENQSLKSINGVLFSQDGVGQYYYKTNNYQGTGLYCYPEGKQKEAYTIPETVEWIAADAFFHNQYLTALTIPNSLRHICQFAFEGCSHLTNVYCLADNVPTTGSYIFKNVPVGSATLHVPAGSVEKYRTTYPWSEFGNIVALAEEPRQPLSFLEGNPIWVFKLEHIAQLRDPNIKCWPDEGKRHFAYYFLGGKKELEGKVYSMMGEVECDRDGKITLNAINRWLPVREENGIVYAFTDSLPGLMVNEDYYDVRYNDEYNPFPYLRQGNECVLYDFSTSVGEKLYPQREGSRVKSYDTYQLLDGTECRVLKTNWDRFDLYEKLGFLSDDQDFGIMDPFLSWPVPTNGDVFYSGLNAYYQDNTMLYKAPDAQEGLCVNDTCWTRDDAEAYSLSYKANPYHEEVMAYIRQLQAASEPVTFTKDQMATIILPSAPDAGKGKYYRLDRCEDRQIVFKQELQPQTRTPYIIVPYEDFSIDLSTMDLKGLSPDTVAIEGIAFIGLYHREEIPDLTGGDKDGFSYIDIIDKTPDCLDDQSTPGRFTIGALRAYLVVNWSDPIYPGGSRGPEDKMGIVLLNDGTGIDEIQNGEMVNGKWSNGKCFDLSGRQITNRRLPCGIYIKGGKKIVIR